MIRELIDSEMEMVAGGHGHHGDHGDHDDHGGRNGSNVIDILNSFNNDVINGNITIEIVAGGSRRRA